MAYITCPQCGKEEFNTETNACECGYDKGPSRFRRVLKIILIKNF